MAQPGTPPGGDEWRFTGDRGRSGAKFAWRGWLSASTDGWRRGNSSRRHWEQVTEMPGLVADDVRRALAAA